MNATTTTQQTGPTLEESLARVCKHYGIVPTGNLQTDFQALSKRPEYAAAFAKTKDPEMALEEMSTVTTANSQLDGWYLAPDVLSWSENARGEGKGAVVRKPGIRVLGADGRVYEVENVTLPANVPRMATVTLGPATIRHDIIRGTRSATFPAGKQVKVAPHSTPIPAVDYGHHLKKLNTPVGKSKALPMDTGDFSVVGTGHVGTTEDDVEYFPAGKYNESLKVFVYDSQKARVALNLDVAQKHLYGLRANADKNEIREALQGKQVVMMGKIGQTYGVEVEKLDANGLKGQECLDALLAFLQKENMLRTGSGTFGPTVNMTFEHITDGRTSIQAGTLDIVGLSGYKSKDGSQVWKITARSANPSFRCKRSEYQRKGNDGEESTQVNNPDGLIWFPHASGGPVSRFAGLGKNLNLNTFA